MQADFLPDDILEDVERMSATSGKSSNEILQEALSEGAFYLYKKTCLDPVNNNSSGEG